MAVSDANALLLQVSADVRGLEKAFNRATGVVDDSSRRMERRTSLAVAGMERTLGGLKLPRGLAREYEQLGADIGTGLRNGSRIAQIALAGISAYSLKLAADAAEIESAFDVAFKGASQSARDFSNVLTKDLGRDAVETREAMTRLQLVLTGTGVAAEQAAEMTKKLAQVGIDAGSLFNTSDAEAFQKIISGISGEAEPLKAFGVVINEAAVKAELLRLGFKGVASDAPEAAKAIARTNLIVKGLAVAQGDAARTADSAANKAKSMKAAFNAAARDLGTELLPVFVKVAGAATGLLKAFNDLPGGVQVAGLAFLGLIAAGGPIAGLTLNLLRIIKLAKETRAAIILAAGAEATLGAGAATGAAAAGVGAAGLAAGATVAGVAGYGAAGLALAGKIISTESNRTSAARAPGKASDAQLQAAIKATKELPLIGDMVGPVRYRRELAALEAEVKKRLTVKPAPAVTDKPTATETQNAFGLTPELMKALAGSGKTPKRPATPRDLGDEQGAQLAAQYEATSAALLQSTLDLTTNIEARAELEKRVIDAQSRQDSERLAAQRANIEDSKGLTPSKKKELLAQLDVVQGLNDRIALNQKALIDQQTADALVRQALDRKETELDGQEQILSAQQRVETNTKRQGEIAVALTDLAYQRARAELEAVKALHATTDAEYKIADAKLKQLEQIQPAARAGARADAFGQSAGGSAGLQAFEDPRENSPLSDKFNADAKAAIEARTAEREALATDEAERTRIAQEGADARARIDQGAYEARMGFASDFFGNLASLSGSSNKTLAAIGKAAAITQATIDGVLAVQKALSAFPPPWNIAAAAAVGVSAAVNVAKIAGLKDGGEVTGVGGPRDDNQLRRLSVGEHVVNASAAKKYRATLEAMNNGTFRMPNLVPPPIVGGTSSSSTVNTFAPTLHLTIDGGSPVNVRRTAAQLNAEMIRQMRTAQQRGFARG